jgi:hypothetical protein
MKGFTYAQLYQALQDWPVAASANYLSNINRYIELGELRLVKDLNLELFDQTNIQALLAGTNVAIKPPELLSVRSMWGAIAQTYIPPDQKYTDVVLLLNFDGNNGQTAITDSSPFPLAITRTGNAALTTTAPKFGSACGNFVDANNGGWTAPIVATQGLDLHKTAFTVECWLKTTAGVINDIWSDNSNPFTGLDVLRSYMQSNGVPFMQVIYSGGGGGGSQGPNASPINDGNWHHVVFSASSSQSGVAVDGVWGGLSSYAFDTVQSIGPYFSIGFDEGNSQIHNNHGWIGEMDEFRVTRGIVRYPLGTNFTPPTVAFSQSGSQGTIILGEAFPVVKRSADFVQNFTDDPTITGPPRYYAELDSGTWLVAPTTDQIYGLECRYIIRPQSVVTASNTWLSDRCGDLMFLCALMEAEHYLKADDRFADLSGDYQTKLAAARTELRNSIRQGDYSPVKAAAAPAQGQP